MSDASTKRAFGEAAEYVRISRIGSDEWFTAIASFDLIRMSQHPAVLNVAEQVRDLHIEAEELAALLDQKASEA